MKFIVLDFGMVLAYPPTGNWHITPKFLELIDIKKINEEILKNAISNNKQILDKQITSLEEEYSMFIEFYSKVLLECGYTKIKSDTIKEIAYNRTYENDKYL